MELDRVNFADQNFPQCGGGVLVDMQNYQEQADPGIPEAGVSPEPQSRWALVWLRG